ncbi:hypothetical protein LCGC14_1226950 [marine sediment metagenome]|uniref:Uncharacterized protein n=1 Tax=marine sediment metagenome TaxID=412755 RepID=A0A0F9LDQ5_9ZZZZ
MNVRLVLSRIRRKLPSRTKLREVLRKVDWLEFENETILSFLNKYNIIMVNQGSRKQRDPAIQDYVRIENEPKMIITVIES